MIRIKHNEKRREGKHTQTGEQKGWGGIQAIWVKKE